MFSSKKIKKETPLLARDFHQVDKIMENLEEIKSKKIKIYQAITDYIICLEDTLESTTDKSEEVQLRREIEALKRERKKFYVPSLLSMNLENNHKRVLMKRKNKNKKVGNTNE